MNFLIFVKNNVATEFWDYDGYSQKKIRKRVDCKKF